MNDEINEQRPSGWWFPARTTAYFLIVAAVALTALAGLGLRTLNGVHEDNLEGRIERASLASMALAIERIPDLSVDFNADGSPQVITLENNADFAPGDQWDNLLDTIGGVNDGAANLFRFNTETNSFDRLSTTFRRPDGTRAGDSQVEPGILQVGHPAFANLSTGTAFTGEVPVMGRLRLAYLTPVTTADGSLTGAMAIDVGWLDDLDAINQEATRQAVLFGLGLLFLTALIGVLVMFRSFRPLSRLTETAHLIGTGDTQQTIELTERRDEIGYLARGLAKVSNLQQDLEHRATTDELTNIPNRAALADELTERFENVDSKTNEPEPFALMILNLEGFNETADSLGHHAANELLTGVAGSLSESLNPGEFVARLNSDEFAVLSANGTDIAYQAELSNRISAAASATFETNSGAARTQAKVGIVRIPQHATTTDEAMRYADLALAEVRRVDRGDAVLYHPSLSHGFDRHLVVMSELRQALDQEALKLNYQPLYDGSGDIVAVEALARWTDSNGTPVSPDEFIEVAEKAGLIEQLGAWALTEACEQISNWDKAFTWSPLVSVNTSPTQLLDPDFAPMIANLFERFPKAEGRLAIEVTGGGFEAKDNDARVETLLTLKELGVYITIDDFGSGKSSFSDLQDRLVDQVKADPSYIQDAANDPRARKFLSDIITLSNGRGIAVALKGIETAKQLRIAQELSSNLLQGFFLESALPAEQVELKFGKRHKSFESGGARAA